MPTVAAPDRVYVATRVADTSPPARLNVSVADSPSVAVPAFAATHTRAGSSMIDLVPRTEDEDDGRNMDHFAVRIAEMDVPALTAHLKRHGIDAGEVRRRYGAEGYGSSIYITDPDGNTVELKGPPETAA